MDRVFTQNLDIELNDAFATVGIVIRAKINRLCNEGKHDEAIKLEEALKLINNTDYKV